MEAILMSNHHDHDAIRELMDRLDTGWTICEQEGDPALRARLEDYWCQLLKQYERACDAHRSAHLAAISSHREETAA
jgi:hypothetical protein